MKYIWGEGGSNHVYFLAKEHVSNLSVGDLSGR